MICLAAYNIVACFSEQEGDDAGEQQEHSITNNYKDEGRCRFCMSQRAQRARGKEGRCRVCMSQRAQRARGKDCYQPVRPVGVFSRGLPDEDGRSGVQFVHHPRQRPLEQRTRSVGVSLPHNHSAVLLMTGPRVSSTGQTDTQVRCETGIGMY